MHRLFTILIFYLLFFGISAKKSKSDFNIPVNDILELHHALYPQFQQNKEKVPAVMHRLYQDMTRNLSCVDQVVKSIPVETSRKSNKTLTVPVTIQISSNQTIYRAELWLQFAENISSKNTDRYTRQANFPLRYVVDIHCKDPQINNFIFTTSMDAYDSKIEMGIEVTEAYLKARAIGKKKLLLRLKLNPQEYYAHLPLFSDIDAFLVLYELPGDVDKETIKHALYNRMRRSPTIIPGHHTRISERRFRKGSKSKRQCRLKKFYVAFEDLGWDDWVLAPPDGYMAYKCSGVCKFPLAAHMNATNHATLQSIAHSMTGRVNTACCVPHQLKPLTLLLYDKTRDVSYIVSYADMIVTSCACR